MNEFDDEFAAALRRGRSDAFLIERWRENDSKRGVCCWKRTSGGATEQSLGSKKLIGRLTNHSRKRAP